MSLNKSKLCCSKTVADLGFKITSSTYIFRRGSEHVQHVQLYKAPKIDCLNIKLRSICLVSKDTKLLENYHNL